MRIASILAVVAALWLGHGTIVTVSAQMPDSATLRALEKGAASVKTVKVEPTTLRLTVGDTAQLMVSLLDAEGKPVSVMLPNGKATPPAFQLRASGTQVIGLDGDKVKLVGVSPSTGAAKILVFRPPFPTSPTQRPTFEEFPVTIVVADRPTERIAISAPKFGAYAGTSLPLSAKVWKKGVQHPEADPKITWTTSDPAIASVSESGVVTFLRAGPVTISAENAGFKENRRFTVLRNPAARIALTTEAKTLRTGDVVRLTADVWARNRARIRDARVNFAVTSGGPVNTRANAAIYDDATFVAEQPGVYTIVAEMGGVADQKTLTVRPRDVRMNTKLISHKPLLTFGTSEVMVFEGKDGRDYAYLGTWGNGDRVYFFDVTDASKPVLTDSILVNARVINDIRVDQEKGANIAVFTREGASDRKNGIVILDVSNPAHPTKLSEFTETTTAGVHDVWIYKNRIYLTNDGTGDMHILDITDPKNPKESGRWSIGTVGRYLHDLIFEDDIAYLSYWDDGMVILDVGGAGKGGTLDNPVFVSQYKYGPYGSTHHVYRYKNYAFISDELFGGPESGGKENGPGGYVHIVDLTDLENPREIARYEVPEAGAHNTWAEDDKLYIAHYQGGLRVVDISGELRGDLYQQGREIAWHHTAGDKDHAHTPNQAMAWSPQPYKGNVYVSDLNSGMWVVKLEPKSPIVP